MSPQASWMLVNEVYPRLASAIPNNCHAVGAEDHQELIQDATALAARMLDSADRKGKQVTPGNVAYYSIMHCKSGRRAVGFSGVDVHGSATQLHGKAKLESFEDPVAWDGRDPKHSVLHQPKPKPMKQPIEFKVMRIRECVTPTQHINTPEEAVQYWRANIPVAAWYDPMKECLVTIILNARKRIIGHNLVSLGGLDTCFVAPREVFRPVIAFAGHSCLLAHNHPSLDPSPSEADIKVTRELIQAGKLLKIELLDHIIVGETFTSLKQLGYFYT